MKLSLASIVLSVLLGSTLVSAVPVPCSDHKKGRGGDRNNEKGRGRDNGNGGGYGGGNGFGGGQNGQQGGFGGGQNGQQGGFGGGQNGQQGGFGGGQNGQQGGFGGGQNGQQGGFGGQQNGFGGQQNGFGGQQNGSGGQQQTPQPQPNQNQAQPQTGAANGTSIAGAAFFISNEPSGNMVISSDIGQDGKLTLRGAVLTGGNGAHGKAAKDGPDPLFSQGAIKTSAASRMLATVNAGSNSLSLFSIDPQTPSTLKQIGQAINSGGEFPVSLAFDKAGTTVCALNGGAVNGVACFSADPQNGLTLKQNTVRSLKLNLTTPPAGPQGTVSHIVFSEDNKNLIASVKGIPPTPGFLAVWDVAPDGSLSQDFAPIAPPQGGILPFSMTVIKGKNALLATDAGVGFSVFDFSKGAKVSSDKSSVIPISGQKATCWSSFSPATKNFFLTDVGTGTITEVNVDDNLKGKIVNQYPQGANSSVIDNDIATLPASKKDFLYVLAAGQTSINVLSLDVPGQATSLQNLDFSGAAKTAGITLNANNLQGMTTFVVGA